jgi:hypothetical protein
MLDLTMENDPEKSPGKKHQFSADRPIGCLEEDLLGRAEFAKSLASAIKGWRGNESLVVSLYGPWGSGKSSVKNMVLQTLRSAESNCPLIVEFNPWQWSGQNQLAEAFFQEIGLVLGRSDVSEDGKRRAAKWRTYGTYLTLGASLAKSLKTILPILGLPGSGIADMLAAGIEQCAAVAQDGSKGIEDQTVVQQQTLTEIKRELSDSLKKLESPILVVLDDIDRLTSEEIRLLFQLVKANADFPNVVYLLLFQRDIVERSLDSSPAISGQKFLEKIVQVGFDICSVKCSGNAILQTLDLAQQLRDAGVPVIGGFHSPMERECLRILLRGSQPIIVCPARRLQGMRVPREHHAHLHEVKAGFCTSHHFLKQYAALPSTSRSNETNFLVQWPSESSFPMPLQPVKHSSFAAFSFHGRRLSTRSQMKRISVF